MNEDPDSPKPNVIVRIEDETWTRDLPDAEDLCRVAASATLARVASAAESERSLEIGLTLADDATLQALNRDYRGIDRPTNVLSFPLGAEDAAPDIQPLLLGDVLLARETLLKEAGAQGKRPADHLSHLVVHGVLHLLGFDHEVAQDAEEMEALEVAILDGLGIADPYAAQEAALKVMETAT